MCGQHIKRIYKLKTQCVVNASGEMHTFSMHTVRKKKTDIQKNVRRKEKESVTNGVRRN